MAEIADSAEAAITGDACRPGVLLPTVRDLAERLGVNRNTVAKAYKRLAERGLVETNGRGGSRVASWRGTAAERTSPALDLANGNPDPALLPDPALFRRLRHGHRDYQDADLPALVAIGRAAFADDELPIGEVSLASGAFDAIFRILTLTVGRGASVAVEDPCFVTTVGLLEQLGLTPVPMPVDGEGVRPEALAAALAAGAAAVIVTPRAHNPTGASWSAARCDELGGVLAAHPSAVLIEDDYFAALSLHEPRSLVAAHRGRWAIVRSVSKFLGADLRLAFVDAEPGLGRLLRGQTAFSSRWVSGMLQTAVLSAMGDPSFPALLAKAAATYAERRGRLVTALRERGLEASGDDGINAWVNVRDEGATASGLLAKGWLVRPGSIMRFGSPPALRITTSTLTGDAASRLAQDFASIVDEARLIGTA